MPGLSVAKLEVILIPLTLFYRNCFSAYLLVYYTRCINDSSESYTEETALNAKSVRANDILYQEYFDNYDHWPILMDIPNA